MARALLLLLLITAMYTPVFASDDNMGPVFDKIDDLLIRVESGISLNSFAESLAALKMEYNKALSSESNIDNPLRSDRMKEVLIKLDDYAKLWRMQDIDHFKYTSSGDNNCYVQLSRSRSGYDIACQKQNVLSELKPIIDNTKSAHYNGW
jgi:hypothetical protein